MARAELPSFDLVVATVDRTKELQRLFESLERQAHPAFRVLLVDQNEDDRLDEIIRRHPSLEVKHLRAPRGLSRARNAALAHLRADLVAFPDDDCVYPEDLLQRIARRFAVDASLGGLTGRAADLHGQSAATWPVTAAEVTAAEVTRENLWQRAISFTIFLRSSVVGVVGAFDEELGLGSGQPWSSGEETDYLIRALDTGVRIEYDPELVVLHDEKTFGPAALRSAGAREGASIGYLLRKHRYSAGTVGKMFVRPLGGAAVSLVRREPARARFYLSTLRGRLAGYRR
ncbi:MAG: glycosyltransferase [Actinobacteria bacterium]|nr:glycosyltransferase [Actinomycetota bacterium]